MSTINPVSTINNEVSEYRSLDSKEEILSYAMMEKSQINSNDSPSVATKHASEIIKNDHIQSEYADLQIAKAKLEESRVFRPDSLEDTIRSLKDLRIALDMVFPSPKQRVHAKKQ